MKPISGDILCVSLCRNLITIKKYITSEFMVNNSPNV
jgi:hypothetical protein